MLQAAQKCFFFWFSENVEKPCLGEQSTTTAKKDGRMVVEQKTSSFIVPAPEGPAGADMCSQPSLLRVWWLVNGQSKYLILICRYCRQVRKAILSWRFSCEFNSQLHYRTSVLPQVSCLLPGCANVNSCSSIGFSASVDWLYQLEILALTPHMALGITRWIMLSSILRPETNDKVTNGSHVCLLWWAHKGLKNQNELNNMGTH